MNLQRVMVFCAIGLGVLLLFLPLQRVAAQGTLSLEFYGDPACSHCQEKEPIVKDFVARHPEVFATYVHKNYLSNATAWQELNDYFASFDYSITGIPVLLLNNSGKIQVLTGGEITSIALEAWLVGALEDEEITLWGTFLLGLAFGGTPCILLIMSVLGTSLVAVEERKKYLAISFGLILGFITAYAIISIIFLTFWILIEVLAYVQYVFGAILLSIGIWQIIEFKKEKSAIFGTPTRVKLWLKTFIEKQSMLYSFLLGILFTFVKIPCVGGPYLAILANVAQNPLLIYYIILYNLGMILPIVILLIAFRIGLQSNRINTFREKYRSYLRFASGLLLTGLAIYFLITAILSQLKT